VSFHANFGDLFTSVHPNIAVFIKNILVTQMNSYIRMNSANNNESKIKKLKKKLICNL
jgi:hypothetical protein